MQQAGNYTDAYLGRAKLFQVQGDYEKAIGDYTQALQSAPNLTPAYAGRGDAYFFNAQYQNALNDYAQAIKLTSDPKELASLYTGRADALFMQGLYEVALADYSQALAYDSRNAEAYAGRGDALAILNQFDQAGSDFNAAIKLDPTRAQAYVKRGDLYFLRGKYKAAIADYDMALKLGISDETRRREVDQRRAEAQAELQNDPKVASGGLTLCTWSARAQFMRIALLNQTTPFRTWEQTYGRYALTAFDQPDFKAWTLLLRNVQPAQKKFIKQLTLLTPPSAAKAFWEKELNAVQQQSIAVDQMLVGTDAQDMAKFKLGLNLWQEALQSDLAAEGEMAKLRTQCLH